MDSMRHEPRLKPSDLPHDERPTSILHEIVGANRVSEAGAQGARIALPPEVPTDPAGRLWRVLSVIVPAALGLAAIFGAATYLAGPIVAAVVTIMITLLVGIVDNVLDRTI
jgi:VIT1/CCC1 family predicted Fe2+/Mn2+ transporter